MKTILVPLDGSALAEQVLPYVQLLAPCLGAQVHLLRAISEVEQAARLAKVDAVPEQEAPTVCEQCTLTALCQHMDCYIASQAVRLREAGVESYADLRVGAAAIVTTESASQWPDPLIAMVTHADQGLWRWMRGSVADQLIHTTTIPMLLVRGRAHATPPAPKLKRILVPLDGSALAQQALPLAIKLAIKLAPAQLFVLQVAAPSIDAYLRDYPVAADLGRALRDQVQQTFDMVAGDLDPQAIQLTTAIALGSPAQAIAEEVAQRQIDLLVMATHAYTGLRRWRLGSVAAELLDTTTIPLLLLRSPIAE